MCLFSSDAKSPSLPYNSFWKGKSLHTIHQKDSIQQVCFRVVRPHQPKQPRPRNCCAHAHSPATPTSKDVKEARNSGHCKGCKNIKNRKVSFMRCSKDKKEQACPRCKHPSNPSKPCHQPQHVSTSCANACGELRHQHPRQAVSTGAHRCSHYSQQHQARVGIKPCEAGGSQKGPCLKCLQSEKKVVSSGAVEANHLY
ncbi:hypothetical protein BJX96DRAFT_187611 [Aspergillus floccosus]